MKKIMVMLFGVAVAINAMAVDYTAKAVVTLEAESGYTCTLTLRQADEYGVLDGTEMNMDGRVVALYALKDETPLQIARAADLTNVPLGLKTDASTNYTITVSSVAGTETLKIFDKKEGLFYDLTEGASYNFTATASTTINNRFVLNYLAGSFEICFLNNELQITSNPYAQNVVVKDENGTTVKDVASVAPYQAIDLSDLADGRYTVELAGGARKFVIIKQ